MFLITDTAPQAIGTSVTVSTRQVIGVPGVAAPWIRTVQTASSGALPVTVKRGCPAGDCSTRSPGVLLALLTHGAAPVVAVWPSSNAQAPAGVTERRNTYC